MSILRNFGVSLLAQAVGKGTRFVYLALVMRQCGAASWGEVAAAQAAVFYLGTLIDGGLFTRATVDKPLSRRRDFWYGLLLVVGRLWWTLPFVSWGLLAWILHWEQATVLFLPALLLKSLFLDWYWQRKGHSGWVAVLQGIRQCFALALFVYVDPQHYTSLLWIELSADALMALLSWVGARFKIQFTSPIQPFVGAWLASAAYLPATLMLLMHQNADVLLLRWLAGPEAVGLYDPAYKIMGLAFFAAGALTMALRQSLAAHKGHFEVKVDLSQRLLIWGAWGFAWLVAMQGVSLLELLSPQLRESEWVLRVLAAYLGLACFSIPLSEWLLTHLGKGAFLGLGIAGGVSNVCANLILIPHFGIVGAAWATVLGELAIVVYLCYRARQDFVVSKLMWRLSLALGPILLLLVPFPQSQGLWDGKIWLGIAALWLISWPLVLGQSPKSLVKNLR